MSVSPSSTPQNPAPTDNFPALIAHFRRAWEQGHRPAFDRYLQACPGQRSKLLVLLIIIEISNRRRAGDEAPLADYLKRYPELTQDPFVLADLCEKDRRTPVTKAPNPEPPALPPPPPPLPSPESLIGPALSPPPPLPPEFLAAQAERSAPPRQPPPAPVTRAPVVSPEKQAPASPEEPVSPPPLPIPAPAVPDVTEDAGVAVASGPAMERGPITAKIKRPVLPLPVPAPPPEVGPARAPEQASPTPKEPDRETLSDADLNVSPVSNGKGRSEGNSHLRVQEQEVQKPKPEEKPAPVVLQWQPIQDTSNTSSSGFVPVLKSFDHAQAEVEAERERERESPASIPVPVMSSIPDLMPVGHSWTPPPEEPMPETRHTASDSSLPELLPPGGTQPTSGALRTFPDPGAPVLPRIPGYELLGELGRGGMGVVYHARHLQLNRQVALKMILSGELAGSSERSRFNSEAQAVAALQHPGIVQIYEIGEHEGNLFFSLEFVDGGCLHDRISRQGQDPAWSAEMVEVMSRAISHAHERNIIHRDLKPANVLLTETGQPKITDFGLAKSLGSQAQHTRTGAVLGTPSYMSPEQAWGRIHDVGPATDTYALGAILYEMLTGQPPFTGGTAMEILEKVRKNEPVPPSRLNPKIPRDLETICLKCLNKEAERRYGSSQELADDLGRFRAGEPILARRLGFFGKWLRRARRHPKVVGGILAVAVALVVALLIVMKLQERATKSGKVADLQTEIQNRFNTLQGSRKKIEEAEKLIGQLDQLNPEAASKMKDRLKVEVAKWVDDQIALNRLISPSERKQLSTALDWLQKADASRAQELRDTLARRDHEFREYDKMTLRPPFENLSKVLDVDQITNEKQALVLPSRAGRGGVFFLERRSGDVAVEVSFASPSWRQASWVGLILHRSQQQKGYQFILHSAEERQPLGGPAEGEGQAPHRLVLEIRRNGVVMQKLDFSPETMPGGPLKLYAEQKGEQLALEVAGERLEHYDPFPLGQRVKGQIGILWPGGARVNELVVKLRKFSELPTALGDELFNQQRYRDALGAYQQIRNQDLSTESGQRLQFKTALCELQTGEEDKGFARLKSVSEAEGENYPLLALWQLWAHLEKTSPAEADIYLATLVDRGGVKVRPLLDISMKKSLENIYQVSRREFYLARNYDLQVSRITQRLNIQKTLLDYKPWELRNERERLIRALRLANDRHHALKVCQAVREETSVLDETDTFRRILLQETWMLRLGNPADKAQALRILQDVYQKTLDSQPKLAPPLLPEKARILFALERWEDADTVLDDVLSRCESNEITNHWIYPEVALMKGFMILRKGETNAEEQARAIWKKGADRFWMDLQQHRTTVTPLLQFSMLASLSDSLTDEQAAEIRSRFLEFLRYDEAGNKLKNAVALLAPPDLLKGVWRSKAGREIAQQIAFRTVPFREWTFRPVRWGGASVTYYWCKISEPSADQRKLIEEHLPRLGMEAHQDQVLGMEDAKRLALSYYLPFGAGYPQWKPVENKLSERHPELVGGLAYVLGLRYKYGFRQSAKAKELFDSALTQSLRCETGFRELLRKLINSEQRKD